MARTKLMTIFLSTALLMAGAAFHNALNFVEHSPTLLYVAGQFKMATGDTNAALDLIGRAATAGHSDNSTAPATSVVTRNPKDKPTPSVCTKREASFEKLRTKVSAVVKPSTTNVAVALGSEPAPPVLMAGFSPDKFRIPFETVREFANEQQIRERVFRQQVALSKLEHLRLHSYTVVMQAMPRVRIDMPEPALAMP